MLKVMRVPYEFRTTGALTIALLFICWTRHFLVGIRRRTSSKKFNRKVTWTEFFAAAESAGGEPTTTNRFPSGVTSRFQTPGPMLPICVLDQGRGRPAAKESSFAL